ncbi:MAG TPA: sigma-70 family RNA polymerase sigma factor [Planctomycetes bacterium]|nr:sigma-70 family RNA polymerase sigma factor [Planctomycetota bacterium]HIN80784.1 sigma-70 family RNA polymerase sigma factor [Planctomycetota bacterium]
MVSEGKNSPETPEAPESPEGRGEPPEERTAEEWLQRFTAGDDSALGHLVEKEFPKLRRKVEARLGADLRRRIDASDILQQAAIDLMQLRDRFENRGLGAFRGFLQKVTELNLKRVIEHELAQKRDPRKEKRRSKNTGGSVSLDPLGNLAASISSPSAPLHREEAIELLHRCLRMLPEGDRELLRLIDEEGSSYDEVATVLKITIETCHRRHSRAIARLRQIAEAARSEG